MSRAMARALLAAAVPLLIAASVGNEHGEQRIETESIKQRPNKAEKKRAKREARKLRLAQGGAQ